MNDQHSSGLTLIEMMTTLAILSVVLTSLLLVFNRMTKAMQTSGSQAEALERLTLIANQVSRDLRNTTQNSRTMNDKPYQFVGIDGDGTFENSMKESHIDFTNSNNPNDASDRIHMHANLSNSQLVGDLDGTASEVAYYALWINGPSSPKSYGGLENRFGLLRRRVRHDRSHRSNGYVVPRIDGTTSPLLDLNESNTYHNAASIVGTNIDYLSFQYYDPDANAGNGGWVNCWDTTGNLSGCDHPESGATASTEFPEAIRFAIRAYDDRANENNPGKSQLMTPTWYQMSVAMN